MRTFNVNVKGAIHVVRAKDFLRPTESVNGRWCFLSAEGRVLWSWSAEGCSHCDTTKEWL